VVSDNYLTRIKQHAEMKHHWKENFQQFFVACGRSNVTATTETTRATTDMTVK
jgi:hypothetical protein